MEPDPIGLCPSCEITWNLEIRGEECPRCGEYENIEQIAEETCVRAKFLYISAEPESIDEMIEALKEEQERLEQMRDNGWELQNPGVPDDYAYLQRRVD